MPGFEWILSELGWMIIEVVILFLALGSYGLSKVESVKDSEE